MTTYAIKSYGPSPFPYFRDGIRTLRALLRAKENLVALGYKEHDLFKDTVSADGSLKREDYTIELQQTIKGGAIPLHTLPYFNALHSDSKRITDA